MSREFLEGIVERYRDETVENIEACVRAGNAVLALKKAGDLQDEAIFDFMKIIEVTRCRAKDWLNARWLFRQLVALEEEKKEAA